MYVGNGQFPFWLVNLSATGALLVPAHPVAVGTFVRLNLSLPQLDEKLDVDAMVVRTTTVDGSLAVALEFVQMSARASLLIRAYIGWSREEAPRDAPALPAPAEANAPSRDETRFATACKGVMERYESRTGTLRALYQSAIGEVEPKRPRPGQ